MSGRRILITNDMLNTRFGAEVVTRDLALGLAAMGQQPMIYTPRPGTVSDEIRSHGIPVAHRLANAKETASLRRSQRHSAIAIIKGMATPIDAKIMWKANDMAICERAASRSVMALFGRQQRPKDLGNAPRLCDAASLGIARLGVEDLADAADPRVP